MNQKSMINILILNFKRYGRLTFIITNVPSCENKHHNFILNAYLWGIQPYDQYCFINL